MTRGKYGAKAVKRQETQALEAEIARLRHTLTRVEKEREEARDELTRKLAVHAAERSALIAERDEAASPREHALKQWLHESREAHDKLVAQVNREKRLAKGAADALVEHMRAEHGWGDDVVGPLTRMLNSTDATLRRRSLVLVRSGEALNSLSASGIAGIADLGREVRS